MKFAINAGLNTFPCFDNLKRWGKRGNDRCPFCGNVQILPHILSNFSVALDQGRYTWRHNSVLRSIIDMIRPFLNPDDRLYSDLPGYEAPHGGTIPPNVLVTKLSVSRKRRGFNVAILLNKRNTPLLWQTFHSVSLFVIFSRVSANL